MKTVLFACAENKKRSKIAEAIFNSLSKTDHANSAGTSPATEIDPLTVAVLQEVGLDIRDAKPRLLMEADFQKADVIVSFGCLVSSMFPTDKFREWHVEDPQTIREFRAARDQITRLVKELIAALQKDGVAH